MSYEILLREHNLKVTPQRLGILSLMYQAGHISVEELFVQIKKQFTSISLATLYKNINAMVENTLISEVKIPNMKPKYEISKAAHAHLLCDQCGEFRDLDIDLDSLLNTATQRSHYAIKGINIILSGLCEHCKESQK